MYSLFPRLSTLMKKIRALIFTTIFLTAIAIIYWNIDTSNEPTYQHHLNLIDDRINVLEKDIRETQVLLETIKSYVRRLSNSYDHKAVHPNNLFNISVLKVSTKTPDGFPTTSCPGKVINSDINVYQMVDNLPFDNPDGGVWKQGFDINPNKIRWTQDNPLQVFVVPHSHTDPGWVKTFIKYYETQTKAILDSMLIKLQEDKSRKFIYAETVFFALWWSELNDGDRQNVRNLISSGRLELVGGGWVMPDEAVTTYYGVLDQLQEGHSWLKRNLDLEIKTSWAIDPFGHSPTIAYMQKMAGLQGGILQRVHYVLKKELARNKNLEFYWRQPWDDTGETEFLTHMMPFYSYDVPHTCGPNPAVCCQFDFNRMTGVSKNTCPWKIPPVKISDSNVAERAAMLVDQYKKKAELFRTDALFIPLGDDFRWATPVEWDSQMLNYGRLFKEINSNSEWNVKIQWGTLDDYFSASVKSFHSDAPIQSLSGDFFTYADRDQHYWSGYYTSRAFQKRFSRVVESQQRSADLLFSLALAACENYEGSSSDKKCPFPFAQLMHQLTSGRRNLAIFQHHDGITGTAKDFVVDDYGARLLSAFQDARYVQQIATSFLLLNDKSQFLNGDLFNYITPSDSYATHDSLPESNIIRPEEAAPRWLTVFNSLAWRRRSLIKFLCSSPNVAIINEKTGNPMRSEAFPHFVSTDQISHDTYLIVFEIDQPALSIFLYKVEVADANPLHSYGSVVLYNSEKITKETVGPFSIETISTGDTDKAQLKSSLYEASFDLVTGTLREVSGKDWKMDLSVEFVQYGVKEVKEKSGAYLFIPHENDPKPFNYAKFPKIRVMKGQLFNEFTSYLTMVEHRYTIANFSNFALPKTNFSQQILTDIEISNVVDIRGVNSNFELAMRVSSPLKSGNVFHTDLNSFQMAKRVRYNKLSLQGNFYPVTSAIAIEGNSSLTSDKLGARLNLLTAQSAAASSLQSGMIDVILDRKLMQDDNRGLGQPMKDNKRTELFYRLVLEKNIRSSASSDTIRLSLPVHHYIYNLQYENVLMVARPTISKINVKGLSMFSLFDEKVNFPCDLHIVSMRPMQSTPDLRSAEHSTKVQVAEPTKKPLLSIHRFLVDYQCYSVSDFSYESTDTFITKCNDGKNYTKLSDFFLNGRAAKVKFAPVMISGRHSSLLLDPQEHSLHSVITPGHIRSFFVSFGQH